MSDSTRRVRPALVDRRGFALGVALLAVTKAADVATTFVALRYVPTLSEANHFVAAVVAAFGLVPGLSVLAVVGVVAVAVVTERGASAVDSAAPLTPGAVRFLGYVPLAAWNAVVAGHNAALIAVRVGLVT